MYRASSLFLLVINTTQAGLPALTLSTVSIGFLDPGWGSKFAAVLIALAKATLIACFFMHALLEKKLVKVVIAGSILRFLILVTLTAGDYITHGWVAFGGK